MLDEDTLGTKFPHIGERIHDMIASRMRKSTFAVVR